MSSVLIIALIFIILLGIVIYINYSLNEGFVAFQEDAPKGELVNIPQYSSSGKVLKLYDNLFFDIKNGNIIEVDSTTYKNGVDIDKTGTTISNIHIITRNSGGLVKDYVSVGGSTITPVDTEESKISTISTTGKNWSYLTKCPNTDKYQLFYLPCGLNTHIHIINITKSSKLIPFSVLSFVITNTNNLSYEFNKGNTLTVSPNNTDSHLNAPIGELSNKSSLVKIGIDSYFDKSNGNILLVSPSYVSNGPLGDGVNGGIIVPRTNGTGRENYLADKIGVGTVQVLTNTWITNDDKEIIVYYSKGADTTVAVIIPDISNTIESVFKLENVKHFNSSGEINCDTGTTPEAPPAKSEPTKKDETKETTSEKPSENTPTDNDFYKWYYWVSMSNMGANSKEFGINNGNASSNNDKCSKCDSYGCSGCYANGAGTGGTGGSSGTGGNGGIGGSSGSSGSSGTSGNGGTGGNGGGPAYSGTYGPGGAYMVNGTNNEYMDIKSLDKGIQYGVNKIGQSVQYGVNTAGQGVQYGVNTAGQGVQYGVNTAGQGVQYGVNTAGQGVQYGVNTAGQGVQYGVNTVGGGIEYAIDKTGDFLSAAADKTGSAFKYLLEREDREKAMEMAAGRMQPQSMNYGPDGMGLNMRQGGPPNYFDNPDIYSNKNGYVKPDFLPITSDFSAFGR